MPHTPRSNFVDARATLSALAGATADQVAALSARLLAKFDEAGPRRV